jgi:glycosyltransferase involved in cell wall biosynthesis
MPKSIVYFVDSDTFGGCEEVILLLLQGLDRSLWRPILFHYDEPGIARLVIGAKQLGVECHIVPVMPGHNLLITLMQFFRELKLIQPDIFHAHLNWPLGCRHALIAAWLNRVPAIVATSHLYSSISGSRYAWLKQRIQAHIVNRYVAVSKEVRNRLCEDLLIPENKVSVVLNGIYLKPFDLAPDKILRTQLLAGKQLSIVFTPARLHEQKGHKYLIDAVASVPNAMFVLAGDGPERNFLEKYAFDRGVNERVIFLGYRKDIAQLLASCDLFVLPSLYEGLPISIIEAMASGKPIIATDIGGNNEAIIHGETGYLVPPKDSEKLAEIINMILANPSISINIGRAAKKRAYEQFSSNAMIRNLTQIYEELL